MEDNEEYIHKELCYEINGCAYEAFKTVGVGFNEINYHKIFHLYLTQKGLKAKYKVPVHIDYRDKRIGDYEIDEIVEDKIVIELKCIQTNFLPENYAQIIHYLKFTNLRLGLLINFGLHQAYSKRVIFDSKRTDNSEKWDKNFFSTISNRKSVDAIVASLRNIDRIFGPGYQSQLYKNACTIDLNESKISCNKNVTIELNVEKIKFNPIEIDYWLVDNFLLLGILAGTEKPKIYDTYRMRSYLKKLNLHHGLIAFWSTTNLQIFGIYV